MILLRFDSGCVWCRIEGRCSPALVKALDNALSYYAPGFRFKWEYKAHRWDGKERLLKTEPSLHFPAGLAYKVLATIKATLGPDYPIQVEDARPGPPWGSTVPEVPELGGITLHPDQIEAVRAALAGKRGSLCLATGFGKTEVAAAVLKAGRPARGLVVVPRQKLMVQTAERFEERLGERIGRIGAGYKETGRRVTVAVVNSLYHLRRSLEPFFRQQEILVYDEAHTIAPGMAFPVMQACPASVRLGLSATIKEAGRRMAVEAFLGPILIERNAADVAATGRAGLPTVYMIRTGGLVDDAASFDVVYDEGIVYNESRNALIAETVNRHVHAGAHVMVLVVRIDQGESVRRLLLKAGLDVPFLHGKRPLDEINRATWDFEHGKIPAMVFSTVGDMGIDLPTMTVLVMGGGGRSPLRTVQRGGRLRVPYGAQAKIIDFYDLAAGVLRRQSETRQATFARKGFPVHVVDTIEETV